MTPTANQAYAMPGASNSTLHGQAKKPHTAMGMTENEGLPDLSKGIPMGGLAGSMTGEIASVLKPPTDYFDPKNNPFVPDNSGMNPVAGATSGPGAVMKDGGMDVKETQKMHNAAGTWTARNPVGGPMQGVSLFGMRL
jgi:hypothetical protein